MANGTEAEIRNAALEEAARMLDCLHNEYRWYHNAFRQGANAVRDLKSAPAAEWPTEEQPDGTIIQVDPVDLAKGAGDVEFPMMPEPAARTSAFSKNNQVLPYYTYGQMMAYAHTAILADRQPRGGDVRRHPLEAYAESYDMMARIAAKEGREAQVSPTSVARDIRHNMIPATIARAALAATKGENNG